MDVDGVCKIKYPFELRLNLDGRLCLSELYVWVGLSQVKRHRLCLLSSNRKVLVTFGQSFFYKGVPILHSRDNNIFLQSHNKLDNDACSVSHIQYPNLCVLKVSANYVAAFLLDFKIIMLTAYRLLLILHNVCPIH